MAKHTPGPWEVGEGKMSLMVYCDDSLGSRVADLSNSGHGITIEQDKANVRLIAAAPEMFSVLERLLDYIDREGPAAKEWQAINALCDEGGAIIAKITAADTSGAKP